MERKQKGIKKERKKEEMEWTAKNTKERGENK